MVPARCGIIPAYAGSTADRQLAKPFFEDHPRIRGEHRSELVGRANNGGSSPHTRGARTCMADTPEEDGIIPAYAGSTAPFGSPSNPDPDHPRIRGEHLQVFGHLLLLHGSSPHTRGAPAPGFSIRPGAGIIPAYAGSTPGSCRRGGPRWDHPRIRGEHGCQAILVDSDFGSSPHTRGAPSKWGFCVVPGRIIPAYAGSTYRLSDSSFV